MKRKPQENTFEELKEERIQENFFDQEREEENIFDQSEKKTNIFEIDDQAR